MLPTQRQPRHDHVVHVYESEPSLVAFVADFVGPGLAAGEAGLVVATAVHRATIAAALRDGGVDVDALRATGRYVDLDAERTLAAFTVDGRLDPEAFAEVVGGQVRRLAEAHGRVHVMGEMVARLWGRGDASSALDHEHSWNRLARTTAIRLCCANPQAVFTAVGTDADRAEMLRTHTASTRG